LRDQLQERVNELQTEFDRGNERLKALDQEADKLRETLLRIAGEVRRSGAMPAAIMSTPWQVPQRL